MAGTVTAADALLARVRQLTKDADPLTPREREIAGLVAKAMSNREIASRLFLSERTVEGHVRNILAKTGTSSRVELTRLLLRDRPR
jgi:DNA-binding NarL/FixJ family response regulator